MFNDGLEDDDAVPLKRAGAGVESMLIYKDEG